MTCQFVTDQVPHIDDIKVYVQVAYSPTLHSAYVVSWKDAEIQLPLWMDETDHIDEAAIQRTVDDFLFDLSGSEMYWQADSDHPSSFSAMSKNQDFIQGYARIQVSSRRFIY